MGSCGILWDLVIVILWDLVGSEKLKSSIGKNPLPQDPTRCDHQEKKIKTEKKGKKSVTRNPTRFRPALSILWEIF